MALSACMCAMRTEKLDQRASDVPIPGPLHQRTVENVDDRRAFVLHGDAEVMIFLAGFWSPI